MRFFTATALVTQLLERREDRELERFLRQLERLELLVLDELGYVPFSKAGAELLFDVVGRAYERTSLMVTTNLPFEAWTEIMGSERLTGALLDRLTHRVHIIEANGPSYRLGEAKRRLKRRTDQAPEPAPEGAGALRPTATGGLPGAPRCGAPVGLRPPCAPQRHGDHRAPPGRPQNASPTPACRGHRNG